MEAGGWGGQVAYGKLLDEIAEAGYEGTELGPFGYLPTDAERLKAELASRSLRLVTAFVPIPLADRERHEASFQEAMKVASLLNKMDVPLIVIADEMSNARMAVAGRVNDERDGMSDSAWRSAVSILTRVAEACRGLGIRTAFHHHAGTFVETPGEVERLCANTDSSLIGLCLDTGHYFYGGGNPVKAAQKYGSRIWHLHLKDVRPEVVESVRREGVSFLDAVRRGVFCELGEGAVDFPGIIESLVNCGYNGWAIVEQDADTSQPDISPFESAVRSRQYLRDVMQPH